MKFTKKRMAVVSTVAGLSLATGGVAVAYWSTSGTGTGTAATSAGAASLVVSQTGAPSDLAPGVASEAVTGTIRNTAVNNAYVTQVVVTVSSVASVSGTCTPANYGLVAGSNHAVLSGSGAQTITLPLGVDLTPGQVLTMPAFDLGFINFVSNQDNCKSAVPTLSYTVS